MIAAVSSSLLNGRMRTLSKIRSAVELRRCLNTCEEPGPKPNRIEFKLERIYGGPMKTVEKFESMWQNPECCLEQCETFRHDLVYLKKDPNRSYTRTWKECEDVCKDTYVCVGEALPPEVEKRPRRAQTKKGSRPVCVGNEFKLNLMKCIPPTDFSLPCSRIKMPGCGNVRIPPTCTSVAKMKCCQKRCTQYPSYSECKKPKPKVKPPIECKCLKVPSNCEVFAMFRKFAIK